MIISFSAKCQWGFAKNELKDHYGAIADYTKAIELAPNNADAYTNRGIAKANLKDIKGCCYDLIKSINLGLTKTTVDGMKIIYKEDVHQWVKRNCD